MKRKAQNLYWVLSLLAAVFLAGCDDAADDNDTTGNDVLCIKRLSATALQIRPGGYVMLSVSYEYKGAAHLEFEWECESGTIYPTSDNAIVYWVAPRSYGEYTIDFRLTDGTYTASTSITIEVLANPDGG